ncbi:MAG: response regulator [Woeseiaceae bacterium]
MTEPNMKPVQVLLVEDDAIDRETIQRAFANRKIANTLHTANDGIEAMEILKSGRVVEPVIILLDINMPRMNGLEFLQEMRQDPEHARHVVFVLTTSSDQSDIYEAYNLNVAGYMLKSNVGTGFFEAVQLIEHYWRVVEMPQ